MNRLAPLVRRADPRPGPARLAATGAVPDRIEPGTATGLADDVRLFATAWAGGVVFFGTMLA